MGDSIQGGNRALMGTGGLYVCHPRERGDPEGEFFQVWQAVDKRKVNL